MKIFTKLSEIPANAKTAVIAIGNFDGVHRAHQELFTEGRAIAGHLGRPFGVLTFEPHPCNLFRPDDPQFRLTPPAIKRERLAACNIDYLYELTFDWAFASQTAEQFIDKVLRKGLDAAHIVVGYDFHFGQLRRGDAAMLKASGLPVTLLDKVSDEGDDALSSSAIRQALRLGDIDRANDLLGWPWEIRGVVRRGDRRGHQIGYPTANIPLDGVLHPSYGVYATMVQVIEDGPDAPWLPSATNIGIRPMFALNEGQVEAHIFDFDRDIYDKTLRVRPVRRLRGEAKFDSLEALIAQIEKDCAEARAVLGSG